MKKTNTTAQMKRLKPSPPLMQSVTLRDYFHFSFNSHINHLSGALRSITFKKKSCDHTNISISGHNRAAGK